MAPISLFSISSIRHASTNPSEASTAGTPPPSAAAPETSASYANLDTITLDNIDLSTTADAANIPEKIGYLQEIGLNYGWGPTSMLEWTIEHIHIYTGLPWWGSVALTAVGIRLLMMPLFLKSSDMTARSQALMSVTKPITDKMTEARRNQDNNAMQMAYMELMATRRRAGLSMFDQMAPMFLQAIIGYCGFKLMRAMAALPVPALHTDGFLWLQDMTLNDPYLILPILMGGTIHLLVRMGGESGAVGTDQMGQQMRNVTLWLMPGVIILTMGYQSALVCVWFAAGGTLGIAQNLVLRNESVRSWLNLTPLYQPRKEDVDRGPLMSAFAGAVGDRYGGSDGGASRGKTSTYTNYQAPNLRQHSSGRVIDVNAVDKNASSGSNPDMIQPNTKKSGIWDQVSSMTGKFQKQFSKRELSEEEMLKKRKEDFKKRAKAFEKRYQERMRK